VAGVDRNSRSPSQSTMLARQVLVRSAAAAPLRPFGAPRNMATLREIEMRLKSVRNIGKITKARS